MQWCYSHSGTVGSSGRTALDSPEMRPEPQPKAPPWIAPSGTNLQLGLHVQRKANLLVSTHSGCLCIAVDTVNYGVGLPSVGCNIPVGVGP